MQTDRDKQAETDRDKQAETEAGRDRQRHARQTGRQAETESNTTVAATTSWCSGSQTTGDDEGKQDEGHKLRIQMHGRKDGTCLITPSQSEWLDILYQGDSCHWNVCN